jgi:hypothetical protein
VRHICRIAAIFHSVNRGNIRQCRVGKHSRYVKVVTHATFQAVIRIFIVKDDTDLKGLIGDKI